MDIAKNMLLFPKLKQQKSIYDVNEWCSKHTVFCKEHVNDVYKIILELSDYKTNGYTPLQGSSYKTIYTELLNLRRKFGSGKLEDPAYLVPTPKFISFLNKNAKTQLRHFLQFNKIDGINLLSPKTEQEDSDSSDSSDSDSNIKNLSTQFGGKRKIIKKTAKKTIKKTYKKTTSKKK